MIHEEWDEGYEPPESDTYAGGADPVDDHVCYSAARKPEISADSERVKDLTSVILDIRELLTRQHKFHHADFLTELAGIVSSAPVNWNAKKEPA